MVIGKDIRKQGRSFANGDSNGDGFAMELFAESSWTLFTKCCAGRAQQKYFYFK